MAKYKLTKTVVSKSNKTETTTPKIKRFTKEQAKKWVATRKAKLGSGVFRNYGTKDSSELSLSANPPAVVVWEFEKVANTAPERKKHSVKRSALKKKETVRRKKPEAKAEMSITKGGRKKTPQYQILAKIDKDNKLDKAHLIYHPRKSLATAETDLAQIKRDALRVFNWGGKAKVVKEDKRKVVITGVNKDGNKVKATYTIVNPDNYKKHTVKKSALKQKETARRKKPSVVAETKTSDDMVRFKVGQKYYYEWYDDTYDHTDVMTVVSRTPKTAVIKSHRGEERLKIRDYNGKTEAIRGHLGTFLANRPYEPKQSNDFAPTRKSHKVNLSALRKKYKAIKRNAQKTQKEQFDEIKTKHPQYLILFRKGDNFVTYGDDVKKLENVVGHASFPATDFARWINVLIKWGYKVAVIGSTNANN